MEGGHKVVDALLHILLSSEYLILGPRKHRILGRLQSPLQTSQTEHLHVSLLGLPFILDPRLHSGFERQADRE